MSCLSHEKTLIYRLSNHFQEVGSLSYKDFQSWLSTDTLEYNTKLYYSEPQAEVSLPMFEIITILKDIKYRVSSSDQTRLDWCIERLSLNSPLDPEIPISSSLSKETLDHIQESSPLSSFRLAAKDEKASAELLQHKHLDPKIQHPDPNIPLPEVQFDINDFNLSIFSLYEDLGASSLLKIFAFKTFNHWNLFNMLKINQQVFLKYISVIGDGYKPLPYHNITHAVDVLQATQVFLSASQLYSISAMTEIHSAALLFSAIIHDFKHPGQSNSYLSLASDQLALTYNDQSILENFHVSEAFQLSKTEGFNVFGEFSKEEFRTFRKLVINAVLGTDMTKHSKYVSDTQMKLYKDNDLSKEKEFIIGVLLHLADLSNTCRPFEVSEKWAVLVNQEFFEQGDLERVMGFEVSVFCDRFAVNIAKSQVGFMNGVMLPFIVPLCREVPGLRFLHKNLKDNLRIWSTKVSEYQPPHNKK